MQTSGIPIEQFDRPTWTLAVLEELKEKAKMIQFGRLQRVLETAMPLGLGFTLYLNGNQIKSEKGGAMKRWSTFR